MPEYTRPTRELTPEQRGARKMIRGAVTAEMIRDVIQKLDHECQERKKAKSETLGSKFGRFPAVEKIIYKS